MAKSSTTYKKASEKRLRKHQKRAEQHAKDGNIEAALGEYDYLALHFPRNETEFTEKRAALIGQKLKKYDAAIVKDPTNASAYYNKARILRLSGDIHEANRYFSLGYEAACAKAEPPEQETAKETASSEAKKSSFEEELAQLTIPSLLSSITSIPDINQNDTYSVFSELCSSQDFRTILELSALEKGFSIVTSVTYKKTTTKAEYWGKYKLVSFKGNVVNDSAIHEFCHHAERETGLIKEKSVTVIAAREKDTAHFITNIISIPRYVYTKKRKSNRTLAPRGVAREIYSLVIATPNDRGLYTVDNENEENIVRVAEAIARYGEDYVKSTVPNLYDFFKNTFVPKVSFTLEQHKTSLAQQVATYVSERLFVPSKYQIIPTEGKVIEKQEKIKEKVKSLLLGELQSHPELLNVSVRAFVHHRTETLDQMTFDIRQKMWQEHVFIRKPEKDLSKRKRYVSIQPGNFSASVVKDPLERQRSKRLRLSTPDTQATSSSSSLPHPQKSFVERTQSLGTDQTSSRCIVC